MSEDDAARLLAELEELRAQAIALSARLSTNHDPRIRYTGEDRNELVRVIVDGHGRATDVVVARGWRQATDPAGLAGAILAAIDAAQAQRLEAVATGGAPATTTLLDPAPAATSLDASGPDLIRELLPMLDRAERQLDEAGRRLAGHFTEKARLGGANGECTITTQGGRVIEIEFDGRWIASAGAEDVARRVCQLFQDAHDRASTGIGNLIPRELSDLMSFAADPERMLRQLGLRT
jgi:DNA-binding protein YbaB